MFRHKITLFLLLLSSVLTAQNKEVLNISVLIDQRTDRYLEDSELLFNEVRNVIGNEIPIHVDYVLENNYNLDKARENYDFLKDKNQDVILVFGVVDNMMIYQKNPDFHSATIVFGSVNRDFIPIESSKTTSGIHNLNYLITPISFSEDLRDFRELYDYKRLAILIDDYTLDLLPVEDLMAKILEDELGHYEIIPVDEDFVKNGDLSGFDAYYVAAGSNLSSQAHDDFIGRITAFNQPSFSAYGKEDVIKGIMASNQSDGNIQQIFRRIALNIERIFEDGDNASDIPVNIQYSKGLTLNFNVAEEVGLGIKYNLISETEFVGDFNKVFGDEKYSLIDVVDKTLSQNLSLKSSEQNIAIQGQELKSVFSNYFPDLGISATGLYVDPELVAATGGFNQEYSVKGTAQLNQLLYSQDITSAIKINKLLKKASESNYNTDVLNAIKDITNVYFNCLVLKTNVIIQAKNLDVTRENLKIATQNYEAGSQEKTDLLRFTSEKAQNTQVLVEARNQLNESFNLMNQLLNQDIDSKIDIEDVSLDDEDFRKYHYGKFIDILNQTHLKDKFVDFLVEKGISNAPELKSIEFSDQAYDTQIKLNGIGRIVPTLSLQAAYNGNFNQWGVGSGGALPLPSDYNVGLNISVPIFNQNRRNIDRKTAMIQKDQLNYDRDNLKRDIERRINDAVLSMINEIVNIELSRISEETAKEGLELTQTSYTEGAVNITQLIDAQRNYLQAQLANSSATYNYLLATLNMEREISYFFILHSEEENQAFFDQFNQYILENN